MLKPLTGSTLESLYQGFDVEYFKKYYEQRRRYAERHGIKLEEVLEWANHPEQVFQAREMMTELLHALEAAEHAPVFVFCSYFRVFLTNVDAYGRWLLSVQVRTQGDLGGSPYFEVCYGLEPPWYQAKGYTTEVAEAVALILDGLCRAAPQEKWLAVWGG